MRASIYTIISYQQFTTESNVWRTTFIVYDKEILHIMLICFASDLNDALSLDKMDHVIAV